MSDENGGKKSIGGHVAVGLAGIGALFARTVDDCGRFAMKSGSAFKAGASVGDDALRGASRAGSLAENGMRGGSKLGSLADDGLRAGKYGSLADDGIRAGKYGTLAEDGLHGGRISPHGEGSLVEEASAAGAKAESHAGEAAEFGVDVTMEVISNVQPSGDDDDDQSTPSVGPMPERNSPANTVALLRARNRVSQPALLPVMPASTKAFYHVLGRLDLPGERYAFVSLRPTPDDGQSVIDPLKWLKGRLSHNPIAMVFYTTDGKNTQTPIPLVLPSGETTDDSAIHRACVEHYAHCIVMICMPEKTGYKEPCGKTAVDTWQSISGDPDMSLQWLLEKLVMKRAATPALQNMTISRLDVSKDEPRIIRSRLTPKNP